MSPSLRRGGPPRFYFSLRSPYSWLAYRDLLDRYESLAAAIEWRPFWEPDPLSERLLAEAGGHFPYVPMSRAKNLYVLQDVDRLRRARGLAITWPVDRDPVWEVPHLAYLAAADEGRGAAFIRLAYRARWQEGRDICAPATMAELAADLGLPPGRLAAAADDAELRARGVAALLAVDEDGVFGVPFFIHRFEKFWGVDRLALFAETVPGAGPEREPAGPTRSQPGVVAGMASDQGHAGGCG